MAQSNLITLSQPKTKKNNNKKQLRPQRVYSHKLNPVTVFPYTAPNLQPLELDNPKRNLRPISLYDPSVCNTTLLSLPKPNLVNLVDGNSPHIPSKKVKVSDTNSTNSGANIATNRAVKTGTSINTVTKIPICTTTNTFAKTPKKKPAKMAKKNKAKKLAAIQARIEAAVQATGRMAAMQAALQAGAEAGIVINPTPNEAEIVNNPTPNKAENAPGPSGAAAQKPIETSFNPAEHKTYTNQQKKKWQKLQAKKKQNKVNMKWTRPENASGSIQPGTSEASSELPETSQDGSPSTPQARESLTTESTPGNSQGSTIPTLGNTKKPNITLKTKKSLQQEVVQQRLNWIKPDANVTANVPGASAAVQMVNQSVPPNNTPQIVEAPQLTPARPPQGSTIPILENRTVEATPRSSAVSFFKNTVQLPKPPQSPKSLDIYAYNRTYRKGIPRSFLLQQTNEQGGSAITADSPIWPNNPNNTAMNTYPMNTPTLVQAPPVNMVENTTIPAVSPIFVQTENTVDVPQPYSPSDVYMEQGNNPEPPELEQESSDQNQSGQKRLSAFHRLGPVTQPKKPKLTINLNLKKEQPIREVVNDTDDDADKYTPVHLRQDILMSADETVTMYLPSWPWRKNVAVRNTATARSSRSVMILEQEKMEPAYEKENLFVQISVKGYPSTWTKERVLDAVLDNVKGYSLIPCFTEFSQHECKFLVLRSRSALIVLHKTGFYIHKDGVELTLTISIPVMTERIDFIPRIILRKRMVMGYADNKLNLSAFTMQADVSHFIYFPLNRLRNQSECIQIQSAISWDRLVVLDLSHNRLTNIAGFDLGNVAPRLQHLNLSHNCLEKITVLLKDRQLPLKTLRLEGNPLCHDYIDPDHYVKVIRMMFPAIVEIDGVPIKRRGMLPDCKQNYCPEEAQEVSEKFLEIYFPLLDSGSDDRSLIQGMYEDDATLTITYSYKLRYGQIYRNFRNLFLYARFLDEGETDSVVGAMAITKLINRWPHTEHDPFTFTVDVLHHTEKTTILRISGVLKLAAETLAEDEHLLSFTRTVVLHAEDGTEYKIHNEMVYWDEPTAASARSAFRVNTISQKNFNLKIESTTDEDLRNKFLKIFMKLTTMDRKMSERCLEINNWNFKLALEHFTKLLKTNNLESLTQETPATS